MGPLKSKEVPIENVVSGVKLRLPAYFCAKSPGILSNAEVFFRKVCSGCPGTGAKRIKFLLESLGNIGNVGIQREIVLRLWEYGR